MKEYNWLVFKNEWNNQFDDIKCLLKYINSYASILESSSSDFEFVKSSDLEKIQKKWLSVLRNLNNPYEKYFFKTYWIPVNQHNKKIFIDISDPNYPMFEVCTINGKNGSSWFQDSFTYSIYELLWMPILDFESTQKYIKKYIIGRDLEKKEDFKLMLKELEESVKEQKDKVQKNDLNVGFEILDKKIGDFKFGDFNIIAGRKYMGVKQLMINFALNISKTTPVLFFSFDISSYFLTNKFLSTLTNIEVDKILCNKLTTLEKTKVEVIRREIKKNKLYINDRYNHIFSDFKALCLKRIQEDGIKVIIIDNLQQMLSHNFNKNPELENNYICSELKKIAKDYDVCVFLTCELSNLIEKKVDYKSNKPQLSDLNTIGISKDEADKIIFIYRPEYYHVDKDDDGQNTKRKVELICAKNKNNFLFTAYLCIDTKFTTIRSLDDYNLDYNPFTIELPEIDVSLN